MTLTLKNIIKNNIAQFAFYRAGNLYYNITVEGNYYHFPVPIEDIGEATFLKEDKAIMLMRYIRKALKEGTFVLRR